MEAALVSRGFDARARARVTPSLIWRKRENARTLKVTLHETIRNHDF